MTTQEMSSRQLSSFPRRGALVLVSAFISLSALTVATAPTEAGVPSDLKVVCNARKATIEHTTTVYGPSGEWVSVKYHWHRYDYSTRAWRDFSTSGWTSSVKIPASTGRVKIVNRFSFPDGLTIRVFYIVARYGASWRYDDWCGPSK